MKVGIHQPQYLPWVPLLLKIEKSDLFIHLDSVPFQKNGLQNRNKIKTVKGPKWLTVPVQQQLGQLICDVKIDNTSDWRRKHWETLKQNYRKAAAFCQFSKELEDLYAREWTRLSEFNIALTDFLLRGMGIKGRTQLSSAMKSAGKASELVLNLCREAKATEYLSGEGGKDYLDEKSFAAAGIALIYEAPFALETYPQQHPEAGFSGDLSALDVLLNCGADWRRYLPQASGAHA